MRNIFTEMTARDIVAIVLIIGCITLKFYGLDGTVTAMMALIGGYYFGRRDIEKCYSKRKV